MSGHARVRHEGHDEDRFACDVELRLRRMPEWLGVPRTVAADLALRADFDLDSVDDIKIAVDEGCSQLMRVLDPDSGAEEAMLYCRFRIREGDLEVRLSVPTDTEPPALRGSFGWHVLTVVTDEVWLEQVPSAGGSAGGTCLGMRKLRLGMDVDTDRAEPFTDA